MTKERLQEYLYLKKEEQQLRQQLGSIEAALFGPKIQQFRRTPAPPSPGNALEEMVGKHLELQTRYRAKLEEVAAEQLAIEEAIAALAPRERTLLRHRYIEGLSWEEVCVAMSYSWRQTHRIHSQALEALKQKTA